MAVRKKAALRVSAMAAAAGTPAARSLGMRRHHRRASMLLSLTLGIAVLGLPGTPAHAAGITAQLPYMSGDNMYARVQADNRDKRLAKACATLWRGVAVPGGWQWAPAKQRCLAPVKGALDSFTSGPYNCPVGMFYTQGTGFDSRGRQIVEAKSKIVSIWAC